MRPFLAGPPPWVPRGAFMHLDFARGRTWGCEVARVASTGGKAWGVIDGAQVIGGQYTLAAGGLYLPNADNAPRITPGYGLWAEEARTMSCLQNRTLADAAWTKANCAVAKNRAGIDGVANAGHTLTPSGANWSVSQALTLASQLGVFSVFLQRTAALNGTVSISLDGGATPVNVTATLAAAPVNTWVRVAGTQTLANPTVTVQGTSAGDVIGVDCPQHETANGVALIAPAGPTSPMLTAGGAVARYTDEHTINTAAGNPNDGTRLIQGAFTSGAPWALRMRYTGTPPATKPGWLLSSDGSVAVSGGADGGPATFQGSSSPNNGTAGFGNWNVLMGRVNGKGAQCSLNGGALSALATDTNAKPVPPSTSLTHCGIGNNGGGNNFYPLNGCVSEITVWKCDVTDGFVRDMAANP